MADTHQITSATNAGTPSDDVIVPDEIDAVTSASVRTVDDTSAPTALEHHTTAIDHGSRLGMLGHRLSNTTFHAFQTRAYRWFFASSTVSVIGFEMQGVALGWLVYQLTHSAVALGLVTTMTAICETIFAPIGGVIADRVERRNYIAFIRLITLAVAIFLAVVVSLGIITYWELIVGAAFFGIGFGLNGPARSALLAQIVDTDTLINAVSLNSGGMNLMRILGPAAAGFLIGVINIAGIYVILALCYVAVILTILQVPRMPLAPHTGRRDVFGDMIGGAKYSYQHPEVFGLLLLGSVPLFFAMPYISLLPIFAERIWNVGAQGYGYLAAAPGIGGFVGALVVASMSNLKRKGRLIYISLILYGAMLAAFAVSPDFYLGMLFLTISGGMGVAYSSTVSSIVQMIIPNEVRGRVMSFYQMSFGISGLSALPASGLATLIGTPYTIALCGILVIVSAVVIFRLRPTLSHL
ncbi:MAG TPA: MFS transporter [Thermomicrobiaceae bacterium]|nr:MFS transporter [Thermomicrobiaceae bacterium]